MAYRHLRSGTTLVAAITILFTSTGVVSAEDIQDPVAIRTAIEVAMAPRLAAMREMTAELAVGAIDTRLRLPACPSIEVTLPPNNAAAMSAKVSCTTPAWSLYVPLRLHAWVDAVVAATALAPNMALRAGDLSRGRVDALASNGGLLTDPKQAEGKILRAGLPMGAPILSPLLDLPIAVRRGQKVVLTLVDRTMTIRATALALEDGRVGDNIAVQNPDSQKTMHATVARDGGVEMKF